ncbi:hypothetical protein [Rubritalea tangerina]|uniref:hypothetical protein n=1 Tax=Rubritalea tangerina TaxID=430798 RepID=UPI003614F1BF
MVFFRQDGDTELNKLLFICLFASIISLAAHFTIGEWAGYIKIPIIFVCLGKYCGFNLPTSLKITGIYTAAILIL